MPEPLADVDLNLLRALDALLHGSSVTLAARRLGITQAAASNALRRLRAHFDDELLVRSGARLVATPLASELRPRAAEAMAGVARALSRTSFVAAQARGPLRVATSDHVDAVVLEPLARALAVEAPGIRLFVESISPAANERLAQGGIDWVMAPRSLFSAQVHVHRLFEEPYVVVVRRGHPARRLTPRSFAALGHVVVAPASGDGRGAVDVALAELGLSRDPSRVVPVFSQALLLVAESDLVATVPRSLAMRYAGRLRLRWMVPPVPLPAVRIDLGWSTRVHHDPMYTWLRERVREIARREVASSRVAKH